MFSTKLNYDVFIFRHFPNCWADFFQVVCCIILVLCCLLERVNPCPICSCFLTPLQQTTIKNIETKGEIAHNKKFPLFATMFLIVFNYWFYIFLHSFYIFLHSFYIFYTVSIYFYTVSIYFYTVSIYICLHSFHMFD